MPLNQPVDSRVAGCVNCGAPSETAYCAHCGQPRAGRLTFPSLARTALGDLVDLDTGLLHTFRQLTLQPGKAVLEYLDGRPRRYTSPVKYAFVAASALGLTSLLVAGASGGTAESDLLETTQAISGLWAFAIFISALVERPG